MTAVKNISLFLIATHASIITRDIVILYTNKIILYTLRSATINIIYYIYVIFIQGVGILFRSVISSTLFTIYN
jgi:hypothetical protein